MQSLVNVNLFKETTVHSKTFIVQVRRDSTCYLLKTDLLENQQVCDINERVIQDFRKSFVAFKGDFQVDRCCQQKLGKLCFYYLGVYTTDDNNHAIFYDTQCKLLLCRCALNETKLTT